MCLSFIIRSDKKYESKGTGVFIRDAKGTRELQTIDEIMVYFPELDINNITQEYYESYDVWSGDITHNLGYMASYIPVNESTLYYYLWRPYEIGFDYVNKDYVSGISQAYDYMISNKDTLEKYASRDNSETYEELLNFVESLKNCIVNLEINYSDEFKIISTR